MVTNADITLYNAYQDNDYIRYKRTYIYGVNWQDKQAVSVDSKGLNSADTLNIYISFSATVSDGKKYISPKAFERLTNLEKDNYFTFKADDKVVRGIIDFEVTGEKPNTIATLEHSYDDVLNIISIIPCNNGSLSMRHWEVGGE